MAIELLTSLSNIPSLDGKKSLEEGRHYRGKADRGQTVCELFDTAFGAVPKRDTGSQAEQAQPKRSWIKRLFKRGSRVTDKG